MKMQFIKNASLAFFIFCFAAVGSSNAQTRVYTASDSQIQTLLARIETRTNTFKNDFSRAIDTSRLNNTDAEDTANSYVADFETATDNLTQNFNSRRSTRADVQDLLNRAAFINQFLQTNRLSTGAQNSWNYLRTDLNTLARYYGVSSNWTNTTIGNNNGTTNNNSRLPYNVSENTLRTLIVRIQTRAESFASSANRFNRNGVNNNNNADLTTNLSDFQSDITRLQQNLDARRTTTNDVQEVLNSASLLDQYVASSRLNARAQTDWNGLKADLNTLAGYYNLSWNSSATVNDNRDTGGGGNNNNPYRVADRDVLALLTRLETRTDAYKREINSSLDRSILNNSRSEQSIVASISDFETATDKLKQDFDARRSTSADVEEVLNRAYYIDSFMRDYRFTTSAESQWKLIRTDLDQLTKYYNVSWNWNRQYQPTSRFDQMLTGTYRLNQSQSDSVSDVVGGAVTSYYPGAQGARVRTNLERRLTSPDSLVIQKSGSQVTIASNSAPKLTFNADGTARTETGANGRSTKITANTTYDGVNLSYEGERANDFYVNFTPVNNGQQLRVTRRVYLENRNDTVTVQSIYDKTDASARFDNVYNNNNNNGGYNGNGSTNTTDFVVPNNTRLTAVMRSLVSTKTSQNGDRFQMEVTAPNEFNGAVIEGHVAGAQRSGTVSGRANLSLEFDTIRLRNGGSYRFAGTVDQVALASGEKVTVNNEGTVRDNNQTTKTVQRAGIGAALGALIGAIAGGGSGAAIGAAVGAGAGAGTVILQGRDDVELAQGTEVSITASSPNNINNNR